MNLQTCIKTAFTVIGKEGSTKDGANFIETLWKEANLHYAEIAHLVKYTEDGSPTGFWGAMSDFSRTFRPWENNFSEGLYLAGAECADNAEAPAGWTKWDIPAYEYLCAEQEPDLFSKMLRHLSERNLSLVGAVHDFTDPKTGKNYMFFPIRKV